MRRPKLTKPLLTIIVIVIGVTGFLVAAFGFHIFSSPTNCWVRPTASPDTAIFTVVMANYGVNVGYNGSMFHSTPWPILNVTYNQPVIIHVINNDTQAHGFSVNHYYDQGAGGQGGLAPGHCFDVRFTANQTGSFMILCTILCTIHQFMQNGEFYVHA